MPKVAWPLVPAVVPLLTWFNWLSPLKALSPILLTLAGNFTVLKVVSFEAILLGIAVKRVAWLRSKVSKLVILLKAPLPIELTLAGSVIEPNLVPLKASWPIDCKLLPKVGWPLVPVVVPVLTWFNWLAPLKALLPMVVILAGNVMLFKLALFSKAESIVLRFVLLCKFKLVMPVPLINCAPNEVTLFGKDKVVNLEHPLKALAWMVFNCVPVKLTVDRFVHPLNASLPIVLIPLGNVTLLKRWLPLSTPCDSVVNWVFCMSIVFKPLLLNAPLSKVLIPEPRVMLVRLVHPSKALAWIVARLFLSLKLTLLNCVQPWKAFRPMVWILLGSFTVVNLVLPLTKPLLKVVKLLTLVKSRVLISVLSIKPLPILLKMLLKVIEVKCALLLKAFSPIVVVWLGIITEVKPEP